MDTNVNEFPMMAGLIERPVASVFCGATIISYYYAVTAAHCMIRKAMPNLALLVGDHNYDESNFDLYKIQIYLKLIFSCFEIGNDTRYAALYRLAQIIQHMSYSADSNQNDISLLRTSTPIAFSIAVGAACLPFR